MREDKTPWQHGVVLVCTNQRGEGAAKPSCGLLRGKRVKDELKQRLRAGGGPASKCRVLTTSCLALCPADGVAVAMVPGDRMVVVDPDNDSDIDALVEAAQQRMAEQARGSGRGLLGRLADKARR